MTYKVIRRFTDGNDNSEDSKGNLHGYEVGDLYPSSAYQGAQTKARLDELLAVKGPNKNFDGPVIELVQEKQNDQKSEEETKTKEDD